MSVCANSCGSEAKKVFCTSLEDICLWWMSCPCATTEEGLEGSRVVFLLFLPPIHNPFHADRGPTHSWFCIPPWGMRVVDDKGKSKKLKLLLLMEVAVQKDSVRNHLSANLQQRSVGCRWRNTRQTEMLSSWGSEARALSQELLLQPVYLGQVSLLSLRYTLHIIPRGHISWGGGFFFLSSLLSFG